MFYGSCLLILLANLKVRSLKLTDLKIYFTGNILVKILMKELKKTVSTVR